MLVGFADAGERPDQRRADDRDEQRARDDQLLRQALSAHFGYFERVVAPQEFELARLALVVELRRQLEERALPRVRHELLADLVVAMVHLDRHHQVARVLQRVRIFAQQFLRVQQVAAGERLGDRASASFWPALMLPRPM